MKHAGYCLELNVLMGMVKAGNAGLMTRHAAQGLLGLIRSIDSNKVGLQQGRVERGLEERLKGCYGYFKV